MEVEEIVGVNMVDKALSKMMPEPIDTESKIQEILEW